MSIYPVRIKSWFPPVIKESASKEEIKENKFHRQIIKHCLQFLKCKICGKKVSMRNGYVYHSMPWGHSCDEAWCSKRCLEKK